MSETCFIYLIGPDEGPQKIGHSMVPSRRLKQFQASHDGPLYLLGQWPVGKAIGLAVERYVHWKLRERHYRGEWFSVSREEAVAAIEAGISEAGNLHRYEPIPPLDTGNSKYFPERIVTRFASGVGERIDSIRDVGEKRSDFIRDAVEKEILRRLTARSRQRQAEAKFGKAE